MSVRGKLWVVSYNFRPLWAGPAERFSRYAPLFADRDVAMTIVTAMRPEQKAKESITGAKVQRLGPQGETVEDSKTFTFRALEAARRERPDAVLLLAVDPEHIPQILLLRTLGIKVIYVSTMALLYGKESDSKATIFLKARVLQALYSSFDTVVCSTEELSTEYRKLGIKDSKFKIIPNGVDMSRYLPIQSQTEKDTVRQELNLPNDELIFMFMGLMEQRKGVISLIKAWRNYKEQGGRGTLLMVGDEKRSKRGGAEFHKEWDPLKASLTPEESVIFHPPTDNPPAYFRAADAFVFCSYKEGLPNVLLEAMATGIPLVTTRFLGFSATFGENKFHHIAVDHDISEITGALHELTQTQEKRAEIGANARAWVEKHHCVHQSIQAYEALFATQPNEDSTLSMAHEAAK